MFTIAIAMAMRRALLIPGFEPGTFRVLSGRYDQLNHTSRLFRRIWGPNSQDMPRIPECQSVTRSTDLPERNPFLCSVAGLKRYGSRY